MSNGPEPYVEAKKRDVGDEGTKAYEDVSKRKAKFDHSAVCCFRMDRITAFLVFSAAGVFR